MLCKVHNQIRFKDGSVWSKGKLVNVTVDKKTPHIATLTLPDDEEIPKKVHSVRLYLWFEEFIEVREEMIEESMFDGICPSLLGNDVEPDGWDEEGFPSALLAYGLA